MAFYIRPQDALDQRLTENGDGTGNDSAIGAYSVGSPGVFYVQPAADLYYDLFELEFTFTTATPFEAGGYGIGVALTNGITITVEGKTEESGSDVVIQDIINGTIKTNAGWGVALDIDTLIETGNSPGVLTGKTLFVARYGKPLRLFGKFDQRLVITYQDDMSSRVTSQITSVSGGFGRA